MFQPTLAPFPLALSMAGFLIGASLAGFLLLMRHRSPSQVDPRHSPEAWMRAGVFGWSWPPPHDGSVGAVMALVAVLAAGFAGGALPRLANSTLDQSNGVWHLAEIVDVKRKRSKRLPDRHFAVVASPALLRVPLRIPITEAAADNAIGQCIAMRIHPGWLNAAWFEPETEPRPCPAQGISSELSP